MTTPTTTATAELLAALPAEVDVFDIIDELAELGFSPADTDADETFPRWAVNGRTHYAIMWTASGSLLGVGAADRDTMSVYLTTRNGVGLLPALAFPATPLGVVAMLATCAALAEA